MIHALPGPEDDEFCIRATASEVTGGPSARAMVHAVVVPSDVGGMIESVSHDPLLEFNLQRSTSGILSHRFADAMMRCICR